MEEINMNKPAHLRTASLLILFLLVTIPLMAQPGGGPGRGQGPRPGQGQRMQMSEDMVRTRIEMLADTLKMTESQEKKLMEFEMEQYKKSQAERANLQGNPEAMREYMMKQREFSDSKYAEILTEEQLAAYRQMMQNRRQRVGQPQRPPADEQQRSRGRGRG